MPASLADLPTRKTPAPKKPERHGTCTLTLRISGQDYRVSPVRGPAGEVVGWRLRKVPGGQVYTIDAHGECSCPDRKYRRCTSCKHMGSLQVLGLIED